MLKPRKKIFTDFQPVDCPDQDILVLYMDQNQEQSFSVGGRLMSNTDDIVEYEIKNPAINKNLKVRKGKSDICDRSNSNFFTK